MTDAPADIHAMITHLHQTINDLAARYDVTPAPTQATPADEKITSPEQIDRLLRSELAPLAQEQMIVLALDRQHRIITRQILYTGTVHGCTVRVAEVVRPAIIAQAPAIMIVHNHPSGDATPSAADRAMTHDLYTACKIMDIDLIDHVIIGRPGMSNPYADGYASMQRLNLIIPK